MAGQLRYCMFTAAFHEIQTRPEGDLAIAPEVWHSFAMPAGTPRSLNKARDRVLYSLALQEPVRIPPKAAFTLSFFGESVLAREYGVSAGIPTLLPSDAPGRLESLPGETWVQLNPIADDFVLQLKLQKMAPSGARDPGTGGQYVYGVARLVVQVALPRATALAAPAPPASDTDRALRI